MGASGTSTCLASQVDLEAKPVSHTVFRGFYSKSLRVEVEAVQIIFR